MSSQREDSIPHELRTAAEPRQNRLFPVSLSHVEQVNPSVRLLQLAIPDQETIVSLRPLERPHLTGSSMALTYIHCIWLKPRSEFWLTVLVQNGTQPFSFLPGQWLDVHIPSIAQAGGFTITSTPADAQQLPPLEHPSEAALGEAERNSSPGRAPYVELAVQDSPSNPSAAWLWKPQAEIIGKDLNIRVGGSFTWPPSSIDTHQIKNVVLIAGGVGIK